MKALFKTIVAAIVLLIVLLITITVIAPMLGIALPNYFQARNMALVARGGPVEMYSSWQVPSVIWLSGLLGFLTIVLLPILLLAAVIRLLSPRKKDKLKSEETQLMQEIYSGLSRMEKRVESLETILLEKRRADDYSSYGVGSHY